VAHPLIFPVESQKYTVFMAAAYFRTW